MAFDEIKAKLGLDVSGFKKGLAKAKGGLAEVSHEARKKFFDMRDVGTAAATALGVNIENLGENLARFITGVTKEAEEAMKKMVDESEKMAREVEANLLNVVKELTLEEQKAYYERKLAATDNIDEQWKYSQKLKEINKQLLKQQQELAKAERERAAENRKTARDLLAKVDEQYANDVASAAEEAAKAEADRLDALRKQSEELQRQGKLIEEGLAAAKRGRLLPSLEDVVSGRRGIGGQAGRQAKGLSKARERELQQADEVQRAYEAMQGATTEGARESARKRLEDAQKRLADTQASIAAAEKGLEGRIKDANPYAKMETELADIKSQLETLNTQTLAPTEPTQ